MTPSVDEILARLGVGYVDIIQCHDVEYGSLDQVIHETIPALRELQKRGKARFVGITGLPLKVFRYVMERTELDTVLSYCHYTLQDSSLEGLIPDLKARNIGLINASPLSAGLLTDRGTPPWHSATDDIKQVCAKAAAHCRSKGVDIAKLALQFTLANPDITTTLVGTANAENMRRNVAWLEEPIDQEALREAREILKPVLNKPWHVGRPENN